MRLPASELGRRLLVSTVLIAALALAFAADGFLLGKDLCLNLILTAVTIWAYNEFANLCAAWGVKTFRVLGIIACVGLIWLHWLTLPHVLPAYSGAGDNSVFYSLVPNWMVEADVCDLDPVPVHISPSVLDGALVLVIFAVFLRQAFIKETRDALPAISMTLLGILYLWLLPSFLIRIRHLGGSDWLINGAKLLLSTIALSKLSDVGAYFIGRRWGRHKLIPRISPAKSVEGAVAGLATSMAAAYGLAAVGFLPRITGLWVPAFGLLAGAAGQCGDLLESLFKRSGGSKDSGTLLPGYGGILDVIDSLLVAAAPAYLFLRLAGSLEMRG